MTAWTPDRVARFRTLWRQGMSAAQVARDLQNGISRSAVLGKVHRLGLFLDRDGTPKPASETLHPTTSRKGRCGRDMDPPPAAPRPARRSASAHCGRALEEPVGRATILSVRRHECRWPIGDPLDTRFSLCGRPATRGSFCDAHARRAYRPTPLTAEALSRLARLV